MSGAKLIRNAALLPLGMLGFRQRFCAGTASHAAFGVGGYASGPMMLLATAAPRFPP